MSGTSSSTNWRDKYLLLLQQQDKYEKRIAAQADQIQRLTAGMAMVVDSIDEPLTRRLQKLQKQSAGISKLDLDGLEQSIKAFSHRKQQADERYRDAVKSLLEQLLKANVDGINKKALRGLQVTLSENDYLMDVLPLMTHFAGCLAPLLGERPVKQSWLQRFLGDYSGEKTPPAKADNIQNASGDNGLDGGVIVGEQPKDLVLDNVADTDTDTDTEEQGVDAGAGVQPVPVERLDADFTHIAASVERVLAELIDRVEPQVCVADKVEAARARLARGLNWVELVPTLEEIRDLIFHAYLEADSNFCRYLEGLEAELARILQLLGGVADLERRELAGQAFATSVREHASAFESLMAGTQETEKVKQAVENYLQAIYKALTDYESQAPAPVKLDDVQPCDIAAMPSPTSRIAAQLAELVTKIESMEAQAQVTQAELQEQRARALLDALTQLPNREAYNQRVHDEFLRWQRYQRPLVLAVCDIDKFKSINDTYGHQVGDRVLQVFAKALSKRLRAVDFLGRYGGEEFVVLLPETPLDNAFNMLDKIRAALADLPFSFQGQPVQVSLSIGLAEFGTEDTSEQVFARADAALYKAKAAGRNRCVLG